VIDLHTHTSFSDGTDTPEALIDLAAQRGLKAMAITDHDTVLGLERAEKRARERCMGFLPGIELEIEFFPGEFHLLGLGLFELRDEFREKLDFVARKRAERNERMLDRLREAGIEAERSELTALAGGPIVGRPHFASLLIKKHVVKNQKQAFEKYLAKGRPFYVPRETMSLETGIRLIRESGARCVLAHPFSLFLSWKRLEQNLRAWKEAGIDGVEAYHPIATYGACSRLEKLARSYGFIITAGSDYHGSNKPERKLGITAGNKKIEDSYLDELGFGGRFSSQAADQK
jgi:3',5'-nucleoside bisphosphate phosphatase